MVKEEKILELITLEYSWEQIIYRVVALENLDPWDLNLNLLAKGFIKYISKLKELDFRIPAKWVIIAGVLLRMKSDQIKILEEETQEFDGLEDLDLEVVEEGKEEIDVSIASPLKRKPIRKITVTELVSALEKALNSQERKEERKKRIASKIKISGEDITLRINELYEKITSLLDKIKEEEVKFSKLIEKWERKELVNTFLPLVYLDNQRKVNCRQEKIFDEIYISKPKFKEGI